MTRKEFDTLFEGVDIVTVKKVTTYRVGAIVALLLLIGVLITTFVYVALPLHKTWFYRGNNRWDI